MPLSLHRLRYFVAVATHGSISAAARSVNVSQPALTTHIKAIEAHYSTKLLNRGVSGASLTEDGRLLLRHARSILAAVDRADAELSAAALPGGRQAVVAVPAMFSRTVAPIILAQMSRDAPSISVKVVNAPGREIPTMISNGGADVGLCWGGDNEAVESAVRIPLLAERLYLVRLSLGRASSSTINFADLAQEEIVMPRRADVIRALLRGAEVQTGVRLDCITPLDPNTTMGAHVLSGEGSVIAPVGSFNPSTELPLLQFQRIVKPAIEMQTSVFVSKNAIERQEVSKCVDVICELAAGYASRMPFGMRSLIKGGRGSAGDARDSSATKYAKKA